MGIKLFIIAFIILSLIGLYSLFIEPFKLKITEWTVLTAKWKNQPDMKIVLLTDFHAAKPWMTPKRINEIVQKANVLNPDIILLLGDYVATHPFKKAVTPQEGLSPLKNLKAKCGVYAVLGNHDFDPRISGWPEALLETGIPVLQNTAQNIKCGEYDFWLGGLKDQYFQNADLPLTLREVTDEKPVIIMMHEPDLFPAMPETVALTVAGHTHGGQVRFPFIGAILVPSKYGTRYAYGHIEEQRNKHLIVSGGLGNSILPIRFLAPPEITVVHLKSP